MPKYFTVEAKLYVCALSVNVEAFKLLNNLQFRQSLNFFLFNCDIIGKETLK